MTEWRIIPSFPDYEVSNDGMVKRITPGQGARVGRILKTSTLKWGHLQVAVVAKPRIRKFRKVHQFVAEAFLGPRPENHVVHHKDFNPANNTPENLMYVTQGENVRFSSKAGRINRGASQGRSKLRNDDVKEIRDLAATGFKHREIAAKYNVSQSLISRIHKRNRWSWL